MPTTKPSTMKSVLATAFRKATLHPRTSTAIETRTWGEKMSLPAETAGSSSASTVTSAVATTGLPDLMVLVRFQIMMMKPVR